MRAIKIIILIALVILFFSQAKIAQAADSTGRGDSLTAIYLFDKFYREGLNGLSSDKQEKACDTTLAMQYLDDAAKEINEKMSAVKRDTIILTVIDQEWYDLPSDFLRITPNDAVTACIDTVGPETNLVPISLNKIGESRKRQRGNSGPGKYTLRKRSGGFQIHLEPVEVDDLVIRVYYTARTTYMDSSNDVSNIENEYAAYIVLTALEKYFLGRSWMEGARPFTELKLAALAKQKEIELARLNTLNRDILEGVPK